MKNLIFSLVLAGFLVLGVHSIKAADFETNSQIELSNTGSDAYVYVTTYENGKRYTTVYTQDGIFVAKYEDE